MIRGTVMILTASLVAVAANAQQPAPAPSPSPVITEYLEVTATRILEPANEVPAAIEVFRGDELAARGATDLRSALALASGLDITPGGDAGPASFVPEFWGLKEFDAFLLVVDGVPWGGAFNPALTTLSLTDVERIEVLRGAAPVMYGATSFVGVIHVVHSRAGKTERLVSLTGGSYQSGGLNFNTSLPRWSGWDSSLDLDANRQGFKDDRTSFGRGHLLWRNERAWGKGHFRFDVDGTWLNQDPASPHVREGASLSSVTPLDANYNPDGAFLNDRRGALTLGFDRPVSSSTWTTTLSVSHSRQEILRGFLADVSNTAPNARGIRENIDLTDVYFDTHFAWTSSARVKLVAGIDHLFGKGEAEGADFDYFAPLDGKTAAQIQEPTVLDQKIEDTRNFSGLYAFAEWYPVKSLRLEGGLRLNRTAEERGEGEQAGSAKDAGEEANTHVKLSGSAGATVTAWQAGADSLRFYACYRNTFKPAAIDFGIGESEPAGEGILKPETSVSYEAGLKSRLFGSRLSIEASAFLMDFSNLVVAQTVGGLPGLTNAGKERFKGIDLAAAWRVAGNLSGRGTYAFHDARFTDYVFEFDPGVPTQLAGKRLETSPRDLASFGLLYSPPRGVLAMVEYNFVGSRFLNKRNTALAESYGTLSASAGYRTAKWDVRVSGRNLNDARPAVSESELGDAQYYRLPARRFDATVSVKF